MVVDYEMKRNNLKFGSEEEKEFYNILKKSKNVYSYEIHKNNKFSKMDLFEMDEKNENITSEHEVKGRNIYHNQYWSLFFNKCKFEYSLEQLKKGIKQIYYWKCKDGLFYWELYDEIKQKNEFKFGRNGNFQTGEGLRDIVNIKVEYIKKYIE